MNQDHFTSGMNKIAEFTRRFVGTNLVWVMFNLPIVCISLLLLTTEDFAQINGILVMILMLAPFVFFPATTAMFGVVRKFIMREDILIVRHFIKYYKENYVRSMTGGICIILLWLILGYYYLMVAHINTIFTILIVILALILFTFTLNFFSMTVHIKDSLFSSLKNTFLLTINGHIVTLAVSAISGVILFISFNIFTFLIPFLSGSLISYIAFFAFEKLLANHEVLGDKKSQEEMKLT